VLVPREVKDDAALAGHQHRVPGLGAAGELDPVVIAQRAPIGEREAFGLQGWLYGVHDLP
jgi:hypothetical protein